MKKVIELIRVSTQGQASDDRASIPAQHAVNLRTARTHGLEIVESIKLVNVSGAAVLLTPEMQKLLKRIEDPTIHGVVVREFSRMMRPDNLADWTLLAAFQNTGTLIYTPDGPLDFSSKSGRFMGSIRAAVAGLERSEMLERVFAAKEEKRKQGKHPNCDITLPFGVAYDAQTQKWSYKPEAAKVREAARLFSSGQTSYKEVGATVGIEAFNLRVILRNPIYTGWRVYDKKRDPSSGAIRTSDGGRQGDRPKIARAPEEVIRVKVLDPIISEKDFCRLQQIMDLKKLNHWRARPDHERKFTFGGFLRCGKCGNLIYTKSRQGRAWYVCKGRCAPQKQRCANGYMRRERLEACLDTLIAERLTNRRFLKQVADSYAERTTPRPELARVQIDVAQLAEKRKRIMDAYFEGVIGKAERDTRLAELNADAALYGNLATRAASPSLSKLTAKQLSEMFSVFHEWKFLGRTDKRQLLQEAMPEVHVLDYRIVGLSLISGGSDEVSPTDRGSSQPRA